jgi:hypothetical protein
LPLSNVTEIQAKSIRGLGHFVVSLCSTHERYKINVKNFGLKIRREATTGRPELIYDKLFERW